ncbi:unnamed protein product [Adineta ricciae]|uniref:Endonuclease n=1 Tax=Adineta ricciae TaxID=249248 RepID=A0A815T690_ADIRI|nr:unnamed protein product [Adineta ricciae]CAF1498889.1 unnamed protein product [Adineta ricciae]
MASTHESKVTLDEVARVTAETLTQHANDIRRIQETFNTLQPQLRTELEACHNLFRNELSTTQTQLKTDIQEVKAAIMELQNHLLAGKTESSTTTKAVSQTPTQPTRLFVNTTVSPHDHIPVTTPNTPTIVVPPVSSLPTFAGKSTERPRQFLLRVTEYARTIHKWSTDTLLQGISQFLKDSALEWYCQLYNANSLPETWNDFTTQFLAQFHSPIRVAQQEHEWDECKQQENETINEFVVRLRSLWLEQKPEETETDFIKHLFCKMRPDMLTLMNASRSQSLSNIITEAQQVEEILYLRNKEARRRANPRPKPTVNTPVSTLTTTNQYSTRNAPTTSNNSYLPTCWRCYETGHYATTCPLNETRRNYDSNEYNQPPLPQHSFPNQPLSINGRIGSLPISFLIDTGSTLTLINSQIFNQLNPRLTQTKNKPPSALSLRLADHSPLTVQWVVTLPFTFNHTTRWHPAYVVPNLWRPCIIGNNFIHTHELIIDGARQCVYYASQHNRTLPYSSVETNYSVIQHESSPTNSPHNSSNIHVISHSNEEKSSEQPDLHNSILNEHQQQQLANVIQSFPQLFTSVPGRTNVIKHHIEVQPGSKPCNSPPYRYAPARRQAIDEELKTMLNEGVITPSKSSWASPVVLAPKKDGSMRFCIDYRKLNNLTIRDAYPLPRIDDTLDSLQQAQFFSTLDLRSGYWQVEMDEASKPLTAFVTHRGLFECTVMPFGLTNAPATFQRLMDIVLAGLKWQCCLVYLDDIIVFSATFEQHQHDLRKVFTALSEANLTLKATKCHFCLPEIKYLGHLVTSEGIKPDPALVETVVECKQPITIKDVQAFLGLTGYYRRFIKNYAQISEPLLKLLRSNQTKTTRSPVQWNDDCTTAFNTLKQRLVSPPIMQHPNFSYPFILELDACEYGIGCVLTQEFDKRKYVIAYASRTLNTAERNYSAVEREALAIVWATKHFRQYIEGGPTIVRSDCKALQWLKNTRDPTGRLARWAMNLSQYNIIIQHRPGTKNPNGDFMSRYPINSSDVEATELNSIEYSINILEGTNLLDNIQKEQENDQRLQSLIRTITSQPAKPFNTKHAPYVLINNLLYKVRHFNTYTDHRILGNKHLLVIPQSLQQPILQIAHDHPTAGHAGRFKTLYRLSSRVYWPSMRKDVFKYVQTCLTCQQYKYDNSPKTHPMQLHTVLQPWHTIGIDIMGPFPPTFRQKRFLLVVVDYFTRWVELFALRQTTATHIANIIIDEIICRYGAPIFILSDNGPQFISSLFNEVCKGLGITRKFTANYHPQTNMTERVNRNLKTLIAMYTQNSPGLWDKQLQKFAFAIRTSINESTGDTPAFLNFGRDPITPLDLILTNSPTNTAVITPEHKFLQKYRNELIQTLRNTYHLVREHSLVQKISQKNKYDKHTKQRQLGVGDLVWVQIPTPQIDNATISHKLRPKYQGPCRLIEQLSPSTFNVLRLKDNVNIGTTNIDRMKLYYEPHDSTIPALSTQNSPSPPPARRYFLRNRKHSHPYE